MCDADFFQSFARDPVSCIWEFAGVPCGNRSTIPRMLGGRSWENWITEYSQSHQHPLNRLTHTFGIPMIIVSLVLFVAAILWHDLFWYAIALFVVGWALQFIGHAIEGKPPEFFKDWRFLLVGSRWWAAKMRGKV